MSFEIVKIAELERQVAKLESTLDEIKKITNSANWDIMSFVKRLKDVLDEDQS